MTPDDASAVALLARAGAAADTVAYSGVTLTTGGTTATPIRAEDHRAACRRHGRDDGGRLGRARRAGAQRSLADASRVLGLLVDNYRVVREAGDDARVAGRPAGAVEARRPDGTLAARFWIDGGTGLLVRQGPRREGRQHDELDLVRRAAPRLRGRDPSASAGRGRVVPPARRADAAAWRAAGCTCADTLPGGLTLLQARTDDAGEAAGPGHGVVHLLYSDGLTEVSVFDEAGPARPQRGGRAEGQGFQAETYGGIPVLERIRRPAAGLSAVAMGEWVWESGTSVLTLVAPATPKVAAETRAGQDAMAALYAAPSSAPASSSGGVTTWIPRGWDRVLTAVRQSWDHLR